MGRRSTGGRGETARRCEGSLVGVGTGEGDSRLSFEVRFIEE